MNSNILQLLRFDRFENKSASMFRDAITSFICNEVKLDPQSAYSAQDDYERWQFMLGELSIIFNLSFDEGIGNLIVGIEIGLGMLSESSSIRASDWMIRRNRKILTFSLALIETHRVVVLVFNQDATNLRGEQFLSLIHQMIGCAMNLRSEFDHFGLQSFSVN